MVRRRGRIRWRRRRLHHLLLVLLGGRVCVLRVLRVLHLLCVMHVLGVLHLHRLAGMLRLDHLTLTRMLRLKRLLRMHHLAAGVLRLDPLASVLGLERLRGLDSRVVLMVHRLTLVSRMSLLRAARLVHGRRHVRCRRRRHLALGRRDAYVHRPQLRPVVRHGVRRVRRVR